MTKSESLIWILEQWNCLAENGKDKSSFLKNQEWIQNNCAACTYDSQFVDGITIFDCDNCPMIFSVFKKIKCLDKESPYTRWLKSKTPESKKWYAYQMAILAENALDKLEMEINI